MATSIFFFIALLCAAKANPHGQFCEAPGLLSTPEPGHVSTLYESTPLLSHIPNGQGGVRHQTTLYDTPPNYYNLRYERPYPSLAAPKESSLCEPAPNVLGTPGYGYGMQVPATVGESAPYHVPNVLGLNYGLPPIAICESAPYVPEMDLGKVVLDSGLGGHKGYAGLGGLYSSGLGLGMGYPMSYVGLSDMGATKQYENHVKLVPLPGLSLGASANALGTATACDSMPSLQGLGHYHGYPGLGLNSMPGFGMGPNTL